MRYADSFYEVVMTLTDFYVPYSARRLFDGWQIKFPWCSGDIACHQGTIGNARGYVETFRFPWDEDDVSAILPAKAAWHIVCYYSQLLDRNSAE